MATKKVPAAYEPKAEYRVELTHVVRFDGLKLRGEITLTGEALTRLVDQEGEGAVVSAVKL